MQIMGSDYFARVMNSSLNGKISRDKSGPGYWMVSKIIFNMMASLDIDFLRLDQQHGPILNEPQAI
jgi:hypothetical protein